MTCYVDFGFTCLLVIVAFHGKLSLSLLKILYVEYKQCLQYKNVYNRNCDSVWGIRIKHFVGIEIRIIAVWAESILKTKSVLEWALWPQ